MAYEMQPLAYDPRGINGLSERLILSHYENNYGGAVKRLHAITTQLAALDVAAAPVFIITGLEREEAIDAHPLILHREALVALEPRAGRHANGLDDPLFVDDPLSRLGATAATRPSQGPRWLSCLLHPRRRARRLDVWPTLKTLQPRNLLAQRSHRLLELGNLGKKQPRQPNQGWMIKRVDVGRLRHPENEPELR